MCLRRSFLVNYNRNYIDTVEQNVLVSKTNGLPTLCIGNDKKDVEYYTNLLGECFEVKRMTTKEANNILRSILGEEYNGINIDSTNNN